MKVDTIKVKGLIDFFQYKIKERNAKNLHCLNYEISLKHLQKYVGAREIAFKTITNKWFKGLKQYFCKATGINNKKPLSKNSINTYFGIILTILKDAANNGYLDPKIVSSIKNVNTRDKTQTSGLSFEELQRLAVTTCKNTELRKAFLFSCFTGLGWRDIAALTWDKIMVDNDNCYQIILRRKNEKHIIPISKQALTILGVINDEPQNVFKLSYTASLCVNLNKWAIRAGITQKLTFSSGRQTFGKLLLQQGVALPLISELLGHKHLKTTIHFLGIEKITIPVKSDYLLDLRI